MRMYLDDIHVHKFALAEFFTCDYVTDINNTLVSIVCIIIKENMLSVIVSLIDQKQLGAAI